jgi:hypothetical protein
VIANLIPTKRKQGTENCLENAWILKTWEKQVDAKCSHDIGTSIPRENHRR